MRFRNDTALDMTVHLDPPVKLAPGEEIDSEVHIIGLTRLDDEPPTETPAEAAVQPAMKSPKTSGKEPVL